MPDTDPPQRASAREELSRRGDSASDQYRVLFERSADAILIIKGETFVDCNQATVDMLRCQNKEQVLRTHPSELSPPTQPDGRDSYEKANEMIAIAFAEGSHRFEWDHRRATGEVFPVEVLLTAVPEGDQSILHVVWRDITSRKELEQRLRQTQKMEAIGRLAGGIAHDFNNLLVAIMGNAELLEMGGESRAVQRDCANQILQAAKRAADLTRQLLAFSRKQVVQPRVIDLNQALVDLEKLLSRLVGEDMTIATQLCEGQLNIKIDPGQIEQIVVNLITNARDAMPRGGTVRIRTNRVRIDQHSIGSSPELSPGNHVKLTISDTGQGMSEDVTKKAFDPFFTTKAVGQGTGLGLSTVYGIVKQSHGEITLHSVPGKGTTIAIYLPATLEETRPGRVGPAPASLPRGRGETILVVEDEPAVSALVAKILRRHGYKVVSVGSGREALECFRRRHEEIDLLLTDVVMPEMGGVELVETLSSEGFEPPVLFASGYIDRRGSSLVQLPEDADLLRKPFLSADLLQRVRMALETS